MTDVQNHYDEQFGPSCEWMADPFDAEGIPTSRLFEGVGPNPLHSHIAVESKEST